jgi:ABC-2 type transport system permease protein
MTSAIAPTARRRPFAQLARTEIRLFLRAPAAVAWTAVLPLIALIILGCIPAIRRASADLHGISYLDAYLPILMMIVLTMVGVVLLPAVLGDYRDRGILRRMSTTPVPPARLLGAQAVIYLTLGVGLAIVMLLLSVVAFGVRAPRQFPGFLLSVLLTATALLALGVLVAALAPNARIANAIGTVLFFPLMFFAGLWIPRATMPDVLRTISDYTPLGAGVRAAQDAIAGHWPPTSSLLVLAGYTVVFGWLAARTFRWE